MNDDGAQTGRGTRRSARDMGRRHLALGVVVGGLALLAASGGLGSGLTGLGSAAVSVGRSLEAVVRPPDRHSTSPAGPGGRRTSASAVMFVGGYFCMEGPSGPRIRLVLSSEELDTLTPDSTSVVGSFPSEAQAQREC